MIGKKRDQFSFPNESIRPLEYNELTKVVLLTLCDGSTMKCSGGEDAVWNAWYNYPVVKAEQTGETDTLTYILLNDNAVS